MNLEVKKDAVHAFTFPSCVFGNDRRYKNSKVAITTATIAIAKHGGAEILAATAMTISGDTFSASYNWDSTGQDVAENYVLTLVINGTTYNRFFDIYNYPFQNTVCDADLFAADRVMKGATWHVAGKATAGSITTLVDTERVEDDGYFIGGMIELFFDDKIETREITASVKSTGTLTFTPAVAVAVSQGLGYAARESFQDDINLAAEEVQERFRQIDKRAYLLIDHTQCKKAIINKTLANYWRQKVKEKDDEYDIKYQYYLKECEAYFANTVWRYDEDEDAVLSDDETAMRSRIRWSR